MARFENVMSFVLGDIAATATCLMLDINWIQTVEAAGFKLFVVVLSGLLGGAFGILGKHAMQKLINKYWPVIIVAILLQGCAPSKTMTNAVQSSIVDSFSVQLTERVDTFYVPGDTLIFEAEVECPESSKTAAPIALKSRGKRSSGTIRIDNTGRLLAMFNCDELHEQVKLRDSIISKIKKSNYSINNVRIVEVKYIPKLYKYSLYFTIAVLLLIAIYAAKNVVKLYFKIRKSLPL